MGDRHVNGLALTNPQLPDENAIGELFRGAEELSERKTYRRGGIICGQGEPARHIFQLVAGVAIRYAVRADGRRHVIDLLLPGDCFGLTLRVDHSSTVECLCEGTIVAAFPRERADALMSRGLWQAAVEALTRLESHLQVTSRITAREKVGTLLLELERRLADEPAGIGLPISRYDIADYLAISVETVSRALSNLKQQGAIRLSGPRAVKILDREALEVGDAKFGAEPFARETAAARTIANPPGRATPQSRAHAARTGDRSHPAGQTLYPPNRLGRPARQGRIA